MQSDNPNSRQFLTPAPIPRFSMTALATPAMQAPKTSQRKKSITTSHNLTIFEPRLFAVMPKALTKELINTMRSILTLGGRKQRLLEVRKQRIQDLLKKLGSNAAIRVYNEFATAHDQVEERLTFKLPLVEEREGEEAEIEETGEAHDESGYHSARGELVGESIAIDSAMKEKAELQVAQDPDFEMEDVLSAPLQASTAQDAEVKGSPVLQSLLGMPASVGCEKHTNSKCTVVPIQNPEAFPTLNVQEIQAQYYPFAHILGMWIHHDENDKVTQVTATLDKGPVDHLIINDPRIIVFLGLRQPSHAMICLQPNPRIDETYQIYIEPSQALRDPKAWIAGELVSARHAYLYWLDSRRTANPKAPPTVAEARILAPKIGRRAMDVWREIEKCWRFEQGSGGRHFRENRMEYLGEDPRYGECGEKGSRRSMRT